MTASLKVEKGVDGQSELSIDKALVVVGNSDAVDLGITNSFVSRRHCQIRFDTDVYYISDLGSKNGTYLNGTKLEAHEDRVLRNGDVVGLARDQVTLIFSEPPKTVRVDTSTMESLELPPREDDLELTVDSGSRDVWVRGQKIDPPLPKKEFDILECLFINRGNAVERDTIARVGWPERPSDVGNDEIDQYIRRLRLKIETTPSKPTLIITRRGHGYMIR